MKKTKTRKVAPQRTDNAPVLVMPRQTADEIHRRRDIREALHDLKAKTVNGKPR